MSVIGGASQGAGLPDTGDIANSLRFRASNSAYMSWTVAASGDQQKNTIHFAFKLGKIGIQHRIFNADGGTSDSNYFAIDVLNDCIYVSGYNTVWLQSASVQRNPLGWAFGTLTIDTTLATAADRVQLAIDGARQPTTTYNAPAQNALLGLGVAGTYNIGRATNGSYYCDLHLSRFCWVGGQALAPTSFIYLNAEINKWVTKSKSVIKALVDAGGANSRMYEFNDATSLTTLGYDYSSKGNHATLSGFSLTAGSTYDWMKDSPSHVNGGGYATLNPVNKYSSATISDGNLKATHPQSSGSTRGASASIVMTSGKYVWAEKVYDSGEFRGGVVRSRFDHSTTMIEGSSDANFLLLNYTNSRRYIYKGTAPTTPIDYAAYMPAYAYNDWYMFAFDADAGNLWIGRMGDWGSNAGGVKNPVTGANPDITGLTSRDFVPFTNHYGTDGYLNFGQQPWDSSIATAMATAIAGGFKTLCQANLPEIPAATRNPLKHAAVLLHAGSSATDLAITGALFSPDFAWVKARNSAYSHVIQDSVRGAGESHKLYSDLTEAEGGANAQYGNVKSFDANGITLNNGTSGVGQQVKQNTVTYLDLLLKAGGTPVTNTNGSITSQVSANRDAGFSIVTMNGTGSAGTVGHGLPVAPRLVIAKVRTGTATYWVVWYYGQTIGYCIYLNATYASQSDPTVWNSSAPTSTTLPVGTSSAINVNGVSTVFYCFCDNRDLPGGIFRIWADQGNASADGPYSDTGGKLLWHLRKSTGSGNWTIEDTARDPNNPADKVIFPNLPNIENTGFYQDFLSQGVKVRESGSDRNASATYINLAILATHGKYS